MIELNKDLALGSDRLNWIIYKKYKGKWHAKYFYSELDILIHDLVQMDLRTQKASKLSDLYSTIKNTEKRLLGALKGLKRGVNI